MLSAVMSVYNEEASLHELYGELCQVAERNAYELEMIFVDDGSTDGSWEIIRSLADKDARVRGIRFRCNFGKAAALSAGFAAAQGQIVMTLDADLQDDPHEIPRFLSALENHLDIVAGWKKIRYDPWHKVIPSRIFNWLVSWMTTVKLHDHNCGMKCYRREVLQEVKLYGELHRFVPVLAAARGFKVGELVIKHRPRKYGHSKYGVKRIVKGFLDLLTVKFLTGFSQRPQHLLGALGLLSLLIGAAGMAYLTFYWVTIRLAGGDPQLHQRPALMYSMGLLLVGVQLVSLGLLAELIIAYQGRDADTYSIAEVAESPSQPATKRPTSSDVTTN